MMHAMQQAPTPSSPAASRGWRGKLEVQCAVSGGTESRPRPSAEPRPRRTIVASARHEGPLRIQRAFHPEPDGTCHLYLLHPPAGLVGGDELEIELGLRSRSAALVTTPGATKAYRSAGATSRVTARLNIGPGARLEWLPQETILFDGARVELDTRVHLEAGATFVGWDILCFGRPAANESYTRGRVGQRLEVWREGSPLFCEHLDVHEGGALLDAPWGLAGRCVMATLVVAAPAELSPPSLRKPLALALPSTAWSSVTELEGATVLRWLGESAEQAKSTMANVWQALRPAWSDAPAMKPRIWST